MAGYGGSLAYDVEAMRKLPIGQDKDSIAERRTLFKQADMNGNGITSLAECDRLVVTILNVEGVKKMKPVINRAFHAARDIVPSVGQISPHYVDFHEFRYFLIYLKHYLELFIVFCTIEHDKDKGKYSDRRMSFPEFQKCIPHIIEWGVEEEVAKLLKSDPAAVFRDIDDNGGGIVLFDEFAHWALWNHMFALDGDDDAGMEEALEVLRKQKPNLCGKDLTSIKAGKAKYRVDAKISGQGCLGGDPSLAGGYDDIEDGGKALAAGGHYPGGLAAWKASFHGKQTDDAGKYRASAQITAIFDKCARSGGSKIGEIRNGEEFEIVEVVDKTDPDLRIRGKVVSPMEGWISILNTSNGFRWAVKLKEQKKDGSGLGDAWKSSLDRVDEASNEFVSNGIPECIHGCGQPRFGRYPTCCTHCGGSEGPHHPSCKPSGYKECVNACGHAQFGKFDTCCTRCGKGGEFPHSKGCKASAPATHAKASCTPCGPGGNGGNGGASRSTGRDCENGCGRAAFRKYAQCCTHCKAGDGPHHRDCDQRVQDEDPRRALRNLFYKAKDKPNGLSYDRFKQILATTVPEGDVDAMVAICDANRNGTIEIEEFLDWLWSGSVSEEDKTTIASKSF